MHDNVMKGLLNMTNDKGLDATASIPLGVVIFDLGHYYILSAL